MFGYQRPSMPADMLRHILMDSLQDPECAVCYLRACVDRAMDWSAYQAMFVEGAGLENRDLELKWLAVMGAFQTASMVLVMVGGLQKLQGVGHGPATADDMGLLQAVLADFGIVAVPMAPMPSGGPVGQA